MLTQPNILFIMTDQQRYDAVAANGNPAIQTPNMDRIAGEGVRFTHSFCAAAACQPSRASILSGVYPHVHGVLTTGHGRWLPESLPIFPELLTAAGYRSMGVGKMHCEPWDHLCGMQSRVEVEMKYGGHPDPYRAFVAANNLQDRIVGHHTPGFGAANKAMVSGCEPHQHIDGFTGDRARQALESLCETAIESPFFLFVSFCGPHDPYDPPEPYASMYRPEDMPLPVRAPNELDQVPASIKAGVTNFGVDKITVHGLSDAEIQRIRALYYGNVTLIDDRVGDLLTVLDRHGLADNTLVIFTSDHADYLGDHDLLWKAYLPSDADMRVPLLMRWPARLSPTANHEFVSGVDLMPTILTAAAVDVPEGVHGMNLLSLLCGDIPGRDELMMFASPNKWRCRDRNWAYTWFPSEAMDTLYELGNDPNELNNRCAPGVTPLEADERRQRIAAFLEATRQG